MYRLRVISICVPPILALAGTPVIVTGGWRRQLVVGARSANGLAAGDNVLDLQCFTLTQNVKSTLSRRKSVPFHNTSRMNNISWREVIILRLDRHPATEREH